jgi:hypothetical protein
MGNVVRVSSNGGESFSAQVASSSHTYPGDINCSNRNVLKENVRVYGFPHIAIDMTGGPYRGYIYQVYAANPAGTDKADIFLTKSTDGGYTWNTAAPVRINDDSTTNDQFMVDVSVDDQGRVWAVWLDSRDDAANNLIWTYAAVSTNGGVSFMSNFKISNQSFNPALVKIEFSPYNGCHFYLGEYIGLSGKTFTLPCYSGQNNTRQDFTAYLPDYGMSFSKETDSISQGSSSSNKIYIPLMGPYSGTVTYIAGVTPVPSNGTITFSWDPGNVKNINGIPDSLTLNTDVSSDVPLGTYVVSITGTESIGPRIHTRSWSLVVRTPIGIVSNHNEIPERFSLYQNYPNPFNPSTKVRFEIPELRFVKLVIYDILGKEVSTLVNEELKPGSYEVEWSASNYPSGVYFYKLITENFKLTKRMILIK